MSGIAAAFAIGAGEALAVSVSPPNASGGGTSGGYVPPVTASVSGGSGAISYAWETIEITHPLVALTPASASTAFEFSGVSSGEAAFGNARVTATRGGQTATCDISVVFQNNNSSGGVIQ